METVLAEVDRLAAFLCRPDSVCTVGVALGIVLVSVLVWTFAKSGRVKAEGKAVVITGCDSGFGLRLAHRLHALGYHVFALCLRPDSPGAAELTSQDCDVITCDVTSDEDVERMRRQVAETLEKSGKDLWAVVNNAGIAEISFLEWLPLAAFQRSLDVNALGMVRVLLALLPGVRRAHGRVVNVASLAGNLVVPSFSAYSMSKFAVRALSDCLRMELRQFGVRVCTIQPALYNTPIADLDRMESRAAEYWSALPEHVREDYGLQYFRDTFRLKHARKEIETRENVDEVIDCMVHAVTARHPHAAYDCHWSATVLRLLAQLFPSFVTDFFILKIATRGRAATAQR